MSDLEDRLRGSRPEWPAPPPGAEARARAVLGLRSRGRSPRAWARRGVTRTRLGVLVAIAVLAGIGTTLAVSLIGGGSGAAAPAGRPASLDFGPTETLGRSSFTIDPPGLAVGADGSVHVAWERAGRIRVASRPADGEWSAPETISDPDVRAVTPQIGVGPDGERIVVWRERTQARRLSEEFTLPSGADAGELTDVVAQRWTVRARVEVEGGWQAAEAISPESGAARDLENPKLVVTPDGTSIVLWDLAGRLNAVERPAGGEWGDPVPLGASFGDPVQSDLGLDPVSGRVIATWASRRGTWQSPGGEGRIMQAVIRAPEGDWGEAHAFPEQSQSARHITGAVNSKGEALVGWAPSAFTEDGDPAIRVSRLDRAGSWSEPVDAARVVAEKDAGAFDPHPSTLLSSEGVGWAIAHVGSAVLARQEPGGPWRQRTFGARAFSTAAAPDAAGGGLLLGGVIEPRNQTRIEAVSEFGGRRGSTTLPGVARDPSLAVGPDGTSAVAWYRSRPRGGGGYDIVVSVAPPEAG